MNHQRLTANASKKSGASRSTAWRARKRLEAQRNSVDQPTPINFGDYDIKEDDVAFLHHCRALNYVNEQKPYPCFGCKERVSHFSGGFCSMARCFNPAALRRQANPLQYHNHCLIPLNRSLHRVCGHCAYALSKLSYAFPSGNRFMDTWADMTSGDPVGKVVIDEETFIIFICQNVLDIEHEYYYVWPQIDCLKKSFGDIIQNLAKSIYNKVVEWNNDYRFDHRRDQYKLLNFTLPMFEPILYPNIKIQQIQNEYNKLIPSWVAIDGLAHDCLLDEFVNFGCHYLWDKVKRDLKSDPGPVGGFFANASLSMMSMNYAYKVKLDKRVKDKARKSQDAFDALDDHEVFESSIAWSDPLCDDLRLVVGSLTVLINRVISFCVKYIPTMHQYKDIVFKSNDLGALLMYKVNQKKHIDSNSLMDFEDENRSNSSLWMINACVNADGIEYNPETDRFTAVYSSYEPKMFCFDDTGIPCEHGKSKHKHFTVGRGTIILAIPPDVSLMAHHVHDIINGKYTMVFTSRGLSDDVKSLAKDLSILTQKFGIKCQII